ncbi:DUF885 domain-containing protein [Biformimicrobium ophioploci]|uniref:DUF885 domain-containing protein n=1 Tax=Biformimicrobium ophioploci TaxID=3036711 RepID=A0ABQ6LXI9_9GAMM|nr:DUF885 domain-containing protein [Microbulbifer sp. NKW57]GMG86831.1 DUF885 domain-containing protein [Microbulbifer sp. NKW57]
MTLHKTLLAAAISTLVLAGCEQSKKAEPEADAATKPAASQAASTGAESQSDNTEKGDINAQVNQLFEDFFQEHLKRSPEFMTYLGMKEQYGKWDDNSQEFAAETHAINQRQLAELKKIDASKLDDTTSLSLRMAIADLEQDIEGYQWRLYNYPVNQMFGRHSGVPSFLINQHQVKDVSEAEAYISRLNGIPKVFEQLIENLQARADADIIAPKFVFPIVIESVNNLLKGAPFTDGDDSALLADIKKKVGALEISDEEKTKLVEAASAAMTESMKPAYEKLAAYLGELESKADDRDGAWKFPKGEEFYNFALKRTTTTDLTAEQIHEIGVKEVERIHNEMREIMKKVNFEGDLQAFFEFMRTDKQFYYPDTEEGKQRYLKEATALIDTMKGRLDELFIIKPKADLMVKAVEPFREKAAGKAFYQSPALDGSRPGIYYANLYRMSDMPTYQMEALAYHEGIPGHHMQLAIAQELEGLPMFRKLGRYTAYTEGWGLYSELIPKEMGFYEDPYSDFGRLAMELWRACRLVVDTGIHAKQWTRQQAIDYLAKSTPNPQGDVVKAIERYIVMPSQATAYKIGMLKIVELREKAKAELGDKFDIRGFHQVVLANGPVPMNILEELVDEWIASVKAG